MGTESLAPGRAPSGRWPAQAVALALAVGCLAAVATPADAASRSPAPVRNLYHPGRDAEWAYLNYALPARGAPRAGARAVAHLKLRTEDRTDELVLILAQTTDRRGQTWLRVELPVRPVGRTGWVPSWAVGEIHHTARLIRIDQRHLRLTVVSAGRVLMSAPVGIGRPAAPTPRGRFYVRDRLSTPDASSVYGPLAFGLSAKSPVLTEWPGGGVVGIHGTNEPSLVPGRPSHGCIRLHNADVLRLDHLITVGVPVSIF